MIFIVWLKEKVAPSVCTIKIKKKNNLIKSLLKKQHQHLKKKKKGGGIPSLLHP